jgi:hypothetical protein
VRCAGEIYQHDVHANIGEDEWKTTLLPEDLSQRDFAAGVALRKYAVRVLDDDIRQIADHLDDYAIEISRNVSSSKAQADAFIQGVAHLSVELNGRIGETLRTLY